MSRQVTINEEVSSDLTSYDSGYSAYSVSNLGRGCDGADSTNYAQINLTRNANAVTQIYYNFSLPTIPSDATNISVSCSCKCSINQTNSSRITTRQAQLYRGTTAMGTAHTVANSTTAFSISAGTWTAAYLNSGVKLRLYAVRGSSSTTSSYYFRLYGATLTVTYTISTTAYTITATSQASGVTIEPASQELYAGESGKVSLNTNSNIQITDNNTDVTSQLVREQETGTQELIPSSVVESTFATDSTYPASNGVHGTDNNTYARFKLATPTKHAIYDFDVSAIPSGATILNVECSVKAYISSESSSITTKSAQLYAGSTAKGSATTIPTTNSTWNIDNTGSWTYSEIQNIRLRMDGYYPNSNSYYLYFYGADLSITYETDNYVYTYTISSINADHTILVVSTATGDKIFRKVNGSWVQATKQYVKVSGTWREVSKVFKKVNGSWVQQSDISAMFDNDAIYIGG